MNTKAAINVVARAIARDAVKREIWLRGRKLNDFSLSEPNALVQMFLDLCPNAFAEAEEIVRRHACKSQK